MTIMRQKWHYNKTFRWPSRGNPSSEQIGSYELWQTLLQHFSELNGLLGTVWGQKNSTAFILQKIFDELSEKGEKYKILLVMSANARRNVLLDLFLNVWRKNWKFISQTAYEVGGKSQPRHKYHKRKRHHLYWTAIGGKELVVRCKSCLSVPFDTKGLRLSFELFRCEIA